MSSSYDLAQVAELLRQIGQSDQLLASVFIDGSISSNSDNDSQLRRLHKAKLLRPDDELGDYLLASDLKRLLNKLLRQQSSYRQLTDMGKVIEAMEDAAEEYRCAYLSQQQDNAEHYLDEFEDLMFEARDSLSVSLENMHYVISSQFGFVSTLSAKVHENQKALDYSQKLLTELQQIDPEVCYRWIFDGASSVFARKVTGFMRWYRDALKRLALIIEKMRQSLFRLRRQEKQADQLKSMARYLRHHPEYQLSAELGFSEQLPSALKFAPALTLAGYPNVRSVVQEQALVEIVQQLRRLTPTVSANREREAVTVESAPLEILGYISDWALDEVERYLAQALESDGGLSALLFWQNQQEHWQQQQWQLEPKMWLELVFGYYCALSITEQQQCSIALEEALVDGTNNNFTYSDIGIAFKPSGQAR